MLDSLVGSVSCERAKVLFSECLIQCVSDQPCSLLFLSSYPAWTMRRGFQQKNEQAQDISAGSALLLPIAPLHQQYPGAE